jgi:AcrR family transcriptional regulator
VGIRQEQKAETRQRILEAARAAYLAGDVASTTIDEVAARARVSKGSVFFHFGSRHDLLAELGLSLFGEGMAAAAEFAPQPGLESFLRGAAAVSRLPIALLQWQIHDALLWVRPDVGASSWAALEAEVIRRLEQDRVPQRDAETFAAVIVPAVLMTGRRIAAGELDDAGIERFNAAVLAITRPRRRR